MLRPLLINMKFAKLQMSSVENDIDENDFDYKGRRESFVHDEAVEAMISVRS